MGLLFIKLNKSSPVNPFRYLYNICLELIMSWHACLISCLRSIILTARQSPRTELRLYRKEDVGE